MTSRIERLRQRALAQGVLNVDDGPADEEETRREAERVGLTYDSVCDTMEQLLDFDVQNSNIIEIDLEALDSNIIEIHVEDPQWQEEKKGTPSPHVPRARRGAKDP